MAADMPDCVTRQDAWRIFCRNGSVESLRHHSAKTANCLVESHACTHLQTMSSYALLPLEVHKHGTDHSLPLVVEHPPCHKHVF